MTLSLQDEIRLLPRLRLSQVKPGDVLLVVTSYGEPRALELSDIVRSIDQVSESIPGPQPSVEWPNRSH